MLISVQVYSCNSNHYSIALACTETEIKNKLKKKYRQEKSLKRTPAVGVMQMQKLRSLFWEQSCESFPFKARSRSEYRPGISCLS